MASDGDPGAKSEGEWVVIAGLQNRHAAEHMLDSLGCEFRHDARRGHVDAFVVSGNADGSLKLTESRVLEAGGAAAAAARVSIFMLAGLIGVGAMLKGAKGTAHASHKRSSRVGSDEQRAQEILAQVGTHAAILLVRCQDEETRKLVATAAADGASYSWDGSMDDFSPASSPAASTTGRAALDKPSGTKS
jgi:hypothetical protein